MIDVDLRRYGEDEEYKQFINGLISGADIDETPTKLKLVRNVKEATVEELACYTCTYAPYSPACNNCLFDSNYIKRVEKEE